LKSFKRDEVSCGSTGVGSELELDDRLTECLDSVGDEDSLRSNLEYVDKGEVG
jgi:hypothetical protein